MEHEYVEHGAEELPIAYDAEVYDAEVYDAEVYDAEVYDAEVDDAEVDDAEVDDADDTDCDDDYAIEQVIRPRNCWITRLGEVIGSGHTALLEYIALHLEHYDNGTVLNPRGQLTVIHEQGSDVVKRITMSLITAMNERRGNETIEENLRVNGDYIIATLAGYQRLLGLISVEPHGDGAFVGLLEVMFIDYVSRVGSRELVRFARDFEHETSIRLFNYYGVDEDYNVDGDGHENDWQHPTDVDQYMPVTDRNSSAQSM